VSSSPLDHRFGASSEGRTAVPALARVEGSVGMPSPAAVARRLRWTCCAARPRSLSFDGGGHARVMGGTDCRRGAVCGRPRPGSLCRSWGFTKGSALCSGRLGHFSVLFFPLGRSASCCRLHCHGCLVGRHLAPPGCLVVTIPPAPRKLTHWAAPGNHGIREGDQMAGWALAGRGATRGAELVPAAPSTHLVHGPRAASLMNQDGAMR